MARAPLTTIAALSAAVLFSTAALAQRTPPTKAEIAAAFASGASVEELGAPASEDRQLFDGALLVQRGPHPTESRENYRNKIESVASQLGVDPQAALSRYGETPERLDRLGIAIAFRQGVELEGRVPIPEEKELFEQARYVQQGRESGDQTTTFLIMVRSVARRLGVDYPTAERLYSGRIRARTSTATPDELAARRGIDNDIRFNRGLSDARRARVRDDLRRTSGALLAGMDGDGELIARPTSPFAPGLPSGASADRASGPVEPAPAGPGVSARNPPPLAGRPTVRTPTPPAPTAAANSAIPPRAQPPADLRRNAPAPPPVRSAPPATNRALSYQSVQGSLDLTKGLRVAQHAFVAAMETSRNALCYRLTKDALIRAGVGNWGELPNPQSSGQIGFRPGEAEFFSQDVARNPKLLEDMGYRRVDPASLRGSDAAIVPPGTIINYAAGCAFADDKYGHIELSMTRELWQTKFALRDQAQVRRGRQLAPDEVPVLGAYAKPLRSRNGRVEVSEDILAELGRAASGAQPPVTQRSLSFIRTWGTNAPPVPIRDGQGRVQKNADGSNRTRPGRQACLNVYMPVADGPVVASAP